MAFNGTGTFLRVRNWVQDAAAGIRILADRHDSEDDNFAQGLSQCITKDGQTTITANLPMANYRHTNVGEAQAINQYARYDQLQLGKAVWAAAGGTADAITASYSPNTIDPVDGQLYYVRASAANATTTPTFSPDGTDAQIITKYGAEPLFAGDISGAGHELILRYRASDTKYELLNPKAPPVPDAEDISYDNTTSGLSADNVQDAIDEVVDIIPPVSIDTNLGDSDELVPSQNAVKEYVDNKSYITIDTPQATTSGTVKDFSIPSGTKMFSLSINGLSTNGTSSPIVQLGGSGGIETTGYVGACANVGGGASLFTNGIGLSPGWAGTSIVHGSVVGVLLDPSNNTWQLKFTGTFSNTAGGVVSTSSKSIASALDTVRITTLNGTDSFDAGISNIQTMR